MTLATILAIGTGGFIGAVSRSWLNGVISHHFPHTLPVGTLGVNLIGSFVMGVLVAYFMYTSYFSVHAKSLLSTGVLGALTTYSTFAIETVMLLQGGHVALALANMGLNSIGTVLMAGGGYWLAASALR
ncbi:MAG: fluoride efflux transporter CrcB [Campylobacterales bacterium]|jgi:CrcB protein